MTDRELLEENNKMLKEILSFVRKLILLNTGIIKTLWNFLEMWQPIYGWNIRNLNKEVDCLI